MSGTGEKPARGPAADRGVRPTTVMSTPKFTARQLEAVDVSRRHVDACVVAGPGSGKTTVLVEYFRRLVAEGVDPVRILAITFTDKAAAQMRRRLAEAFREDAEIRPKLERAWVSTVHGFCARLLRENAVAAGVDPEFTIADEREVGRWQQESMAEAMESIFADHPAAVRALIRGLASSSFEAAILSAYDAMRGAGTEIGALAGFPMPAGTLLADIAETLGELRRDDISDWNGAQKGEFEAALEAMARIVAAPGPREALVAVEGCNYKLTKFKRGNAAYDLLKNLRDEQLKRLQQTLVTGLYASERELLIEVLRRFDGIYRQRKSQAGALDFADLEEFAVGLLENNPETRARLQSQFEHVLMDELQDTNGQQARLLRLVRPPGRFYAVGDVNQSIFGFRHAEPAEFLKFRSEAAASGGRVVELVENFRSRPEILHAVETIVAGAPGIERRRLIAGKTFDDADGDAPRVEAIVAPSVDAEARAVARRMLCLLETEPRHSFRDIAVLVRNTEVLAEFMAAFDDAGIPYVVNRGKGFYETREVGDLVQLLRAIANPRDEISLAAVLRSPLVGASDEALLRLRLLGGDLAGALMSLRRGRRSGVRPGGSRGAVPLPRPPAGMAAAARVRVVRPAAARRHGRNRIWRGAGQPRRGQYRQVSGAGSGRRAAHFARRLRAGSGNAAREQPRGAGFGAGRRLRRGAGDDRALGQGPGVSYRFRRGHAQGRAGQSAGGGLFAALGLGASWRNPARREEIDDLFHRAIREERHEREALEADRLLYVAMTRAEHRLVLSFSTGGRKPANWARQVADNLLLDVAKAGERTLERVTPDGETWKLRVSVDADVGQAIRLPTPERRNRQPRAGAGGAAAAARGDRPVREQRHGDGAGAVRQVSAGVLSGRVPGVPGSRAKPRRAPRAMPSRPASWAPRCMPCWRGSRWSIPIRRPCAWPRRFAKGRWAGAWSGPRAWSGSSIS